MKRENPIAYVYIAQPKITIVPISGKTHFTLHIPCANQSLYKDNAGPNLIAYVMHNNKYHWPVPLSGSQLHVSCGGSLLKASPTIPTKDCPPACSKPGLSSSTATACRQRMIAAVTTPMSGTRGTKCRAGGAGEGRAALGPWGRKGRNLICIFVLFLFLVLLLGGRVEKITKQCLARHA